MAAAKTKDRKFPQAEFEIALEDALDALLDNNDVAPGDEWHFHVDGNVLRITRTRAPEPNQASPAQSRSPQSR